MIKRKVWFTVIGLLAAGSIAVPLALACDAPASATNKQPAAAASAQPAAAKKAPAGQGRAPASAASASSAAATASYTDKNGYTITIAGGYDTDPVDNGRPVVLIASALGVPTETFREAFSGVSPAKDGAPTTEREQANKAVLLKVLAPYGITNDRLDEVSNYYRYMASKGEVWARTPAVLTTTVKDGQVTGIEIENPGSGYSSAPTVTITSPQGEKLLATTTVAYTSDFQTNGSLESVKLAE
ncbi:hypothetical protein [Cohnella fermenti]|uniref:Lipoprotein n=1 Tax=Cohnella fermenti TaxID=2565925 RepID=A0A4S4BZ12_9BACL|nr:hypothetical protein [Cohnella fermenti]THF79972.1 hypothetical protein E6C55_11660 [Cohnella fermenti]